LRPGGDPIALASATVRCANCGCVLAEDEAQAVRWGFWSDGVGDMYPFCEECAKREFAADAPASMDSSGQVTRDPQIASASSTTSASE
jgi:hypothetical protein